MSQVTSEEQEKQDAANIADEAEERDTAKIAEEAEEPDMAKTIPEGETEEKEPRDQEVSPSSGVGLPRPPWPPDHKPPQRAPNWSRNKSAREMLGEECSTPLPVQNNNDLASMDHVDKAPVEDEAPFQSRDHALEEREEERLVRD